jgi:molybdate transport system substrate-binding protein
MTPLVLLVSMLLLGGTVAAQEIRVAVAANFAETLRDVAGLYQQSHQQSVRVSVGSTGSLFSQIEHGAPFDLFFAADSRRPALLVERGLAVAGTRRTYAIGTLVLWSPDVSLISDWSVLRSDRFTHLAIANPATAPYGQAAQEALQAMGLWSLLRPRLVEAQSIGQAQQFVSAGAAQLGLVAWSQVHRPDADSPGSWLTVDASLHQAIEQQLVVLQDRPAIRAFADWICRDPAATARIQAYGYRLATKH